MFRKIKLWLAFAAIVFISVIILPGKLVFAVCSITSTSNGSDDVVACSAASPDTDGIATGGGNDRITVESGASVSGYVTVDGDPAAVNAGSGSDTVTNYGTIHGRYDAVSMRTGTNDVLNNYGSIIGDDDGVWCAQASGDTCTINNYSTGTIQSVKEAIDVYGSGRTVIYNEGMIQSTDQETIHLIGTTNTITNRGTIDGSHNGIEPSAGGPATIYNWGMIRSRRERAIDLDSAHDLVYNYGTMQGDRDPGVILSAGNDRFYNYGNIIGYCYFDLQESVLDGGYGNDYILNSGSIQQLNQTYAAIEAGGGNDTVVIQGGLIYGVIDGDGDDAIDDSPFYDVLIFEFTGVQSEVDAFRAQVNSQSPQSGSASFHNQTFYWRNFEEIRMNLTVVPGTAVPTWTPTIPPTPTRTPTPPPALEVGYYEQTSSRFQYVGTVWTTLSNANASAGSYRVSRDVIAGIYFTFRGNKLTIYRTMDSTMGLMHVCIDGGCQTVDSYSSSPQWKQPIVLWANDPNAYHNVSIERISNGGSQYINLDAVRVEVAINPGGTAIPTSTPTQIPTQAATSVPTSTLPPTAFPTASSTTPRLVPGFYEQNRSYFTYSGTWATISDANASGGSYRQSKDPAGRVRFYFRGNRLTIYRTMNYDRNSARICIDGTCQSIDNYSQSILYQQPVVFTVADQNATHFVEISNLSTAYFDLDAVRVEDTASTAIPTSTATMTRTPTRTPTVGVGPTSTATRTPSGPTATPAPSGSAPVLVAPADGAAVSIPITFQWQVVSGAVSYRIYIATDSGFSNVISNQSVTTTSYTRTNSLANGTYYWKVRSSASNGSVSPWSQTRSFVIGGSSVQSNSVNEATVEPAAPMPTQPPTASPVSGALPAGYYEESDTRITYTGAWFIGAFDQLSGGATNNTTTADDSASFTFYGTGFALYRVTGPNRGMMEVCIDGVCQQVNNDGTDYLFQQAAVFGGYALGAHTVVIRNLTAGEYLDMDAIRIDP